MEVMQDEDERFSVTDDRSAAWAMEKIKQAREDTERWRAYYAGQMTKIEEANASTEAYFYSLLEGYFSTVPHKATRTQQSYQLPNGKLVLKAQQPTYERDEDTMVSWARTSCPGMIRTKESIDWAQLKKALTWAPNGDAVYPDTGEVVPGLKAIEREPVFQVQFKED